MRLKLFLLLLLSAAMSMTAQTATVTGMVVNSNSGSPVSGATVSIREKAADSGLGGDFRMSGITPGTQYVTVTCEGYAAAGFDVNLYPGENSLGAIRLEPADFNNEFYADQEDLIFDDALFEDEEGSTQSVSALNGASDDVFYNNASYNFSPMYYRFRGMDNAYQTVYINGVAMNDLVRGRFNFSSLMGMT
ncbi:MAG: carboxypeptidase-like regulatory domain-containing protein, partial [Muribaculaceae bacterium]|nr:carboxypeptidase-like regulatory domain-containing protein [Muribaculaceae bacterium]